GQYPGQLKAYVDAETGATLTRNQVRDLALRVGWALKWHEEIKAKRGEVVMIFSPNSLNWPVALFGSVAAGLRCTPANSAYMPETLMLQYEDSGAKIVFVAEELVSVVLEMFKLLGVAELEARRRIIVLENGLEWAGGPPASKVNAAKGLKTLADLMKAGGKLDREENFDGEQANETVYLCYSSGTTGRSKGVETTHFNINAAQEILRPPFPKLYPGKDLMLGMLPFYHIYGTSALILLMDLTEYSITIGMVELLHFPILCGIPVVIMPRFDPVKFCAYIDQYMITTILIVPPILLVLASHPAVDNYDMSSLKTLVSGAAPLGPGLVNQVTKRLRFRRNRKDDVVISQGYGLTETSPSTHFLPVSDAVRKVGSIGILLPNLEARLVVDVDAEANEGEPGELWIRGPTVMKGYLNNAAATKDSITPDEWFKTGDIATRDSEGFYYVVDRKKELIKYKGFQVAPAELEGLLLNHPDVADAAVIGVYSESRATELPR
ncbi:putative 4-coumarate--CoA ligase 1, partial [Termitomyces sp. T112]